MARESYTGDVGIKLNTDAGYFDGEFDDAGRVVLIDGPAEVGQCVEMRLALWRGGWCVDPTHGFPWMRFLGRKDVTPELLATNMRAVVMRDERIRRMTECTVTPIELSRVYEVVFSGQTATGEALKREFVAQTG